MASNGINVLRYGALLFGVFYGITHQSALKAAAADAHANNEYARKNKLIEQAKAEFQKKNSPAQPAQSQNTVANPEDPNFDLEAYLTQVAAEAK